MSKPIPHVTYWRHGVHVLNSAVASDWLCSPFALSFLPSPLSCENCKAQIGIKWHHMDGICFQFLLYFNTSAIWVTSPRTTSSGAYSHTLNRGSAQIKGRNDEGNVSKNAGEIQRNISNRNKKEGRTVPWRQSQRKTLREQKWSIHCLQPKDISN